MRARAGRSHAAQIVNPRKVKGASGGGGVTSIPACGRQSMHGNKVIPMQA